MKQKGYISNFEGIILSLKDEHWQLITTPNKFVGEKITFQCRFSEPSVNGTNYGKVRLESQHANGTWISEVFVYSLSNRFAVFVNFT